MFQKLLFLLWRSLVEYHAWTLTISALKMRKSLVRICSNRNTKLNSLKAHILFLMIWYFATFWVQIFWDIYWQPYCQICDGQQPNLKVFGCNNFDGSSSPPFDQEMTNAWVASGGRFGERRQTKHVLHDLHHIPICHRLKQIWVWNLAPNPWNHTRVNVIMTTRGEAVRRSNRIV